MSHSGSISLARRTSTPAPRPLGRSSASSATIHWATRTTLVSASSAEPPPASASCRPPARTRFATRSGYPARRDVRRATDAVSLVMPSRRVARSARAASAARVTARVAPASSPMARSALLERSFLGLAVERRRALRRRSARSRRRERVPLRSGSSAPRECRARRGSPRRRTRRSATPRRSASTRTRAWRGWTAKREHRAARLGERAGRIDGAEAPRAARRQRRVRARRRLEPRISPAPDRLELQHGLREIEPQDLRRLVLRPRLVIGLRVEAKHRPGRVLPARPARWVADARLVFSTRSRGSPDHGACVATRASPRRRRRRRRRW